MTELPFSLLTLLSLTQHRSSVRRITPLSRYSYTLAGHITEVEFGSSVLPPFSLSLSPPCLVFFCHLFFFNFLLCKTDRSGAGFKVNGKAAFSPARFAVHACHSSAGSLSPFPLSLYILVFLLVLHPFSIFSCYCTFSSIGTITLLLYCIHCMPNDSFK